MWCREGRREKRLYSPLLGEIYAETMGSASLGIRQSPQGLSETLPTLGHNHTEGGQDYMIPAGFV